MMTRKDYTAIAAIVAGEFRHGSPDDPMAYKDLVVSALTAYMTEDNPRFDRDRFFAACYAGEV